MRTHRSMPRSGRIPALVTVSLAPLLLATGASAHECREEACEYFLFIPFNCTGLCDLSVETKLEGFVPGFDVGLSSCTLHEWDSGAPDNVGAKLVTSLKLLEPGDSETFRCLDASNLMEGDYIARVEIFDTFLNPLSHRLVSLTGLDSDLGVTVAFAQQSEDPEPVFAAFLSFSPLTEIGFLYLSGHSGEADPDGDGVGAGADRCPDTPALAEVDGFGCSQEQFCASQPAATQEEGWECKQADWRNDEPGMRGSDRDCDLGYLPDGTRVCVIGRSDSAGVITPPN